MDAPLSPDHVFDFLADEPEPELVHVPVAINGWIKEDESVGNPEGDQEEELHMDIDEDEEEEEDEGDWEEDDKWLMALVTPRGLLGLHPALMRAENLEHGHKMLVRKIEDVSDAQVDDGIAIGELRPKEVRTKNQMLLTHLEASESRESALLRYLLWMKGRLTALE
ncbi:hypothetical protein Tco_0438138 [Tanacetum coccineum]